MTTYTLQHRPSKLDLIDSTQLTSFPIPHPASQHSDGINRIRECKLYSGLTTTSVNRDSSFEDINNDSNTFGPFTLNVDDSAMPPTPPSSAELFSETTYDFRKVLDESFPTKAAAAASTVKECEDPYLRSILSDGNTSQDFKPLHYCSLCDTPLYEISNLIPDDSQHRELVCESCSRNDESCTVHIVDEMDMTIQSDDVDLTIIRHESPLLPNMQFEKIISNLKRVSQVDLRLRQSVIRQNDTTIQQVSLWMAIKQRIFGVQ